MGGGVSNPGCQGICHNPEEEPEPGPCGSAHHGFCPLGSQAWDFLGNHFLDEEVKLIKKLRADHLTPPLEAGLPLGGAGGVAL